VAKNPVVLRTEIELSGTTHADRLLAALARRRTTTSAPLGFGPGAHVQSHHLTATSGRRTTPMNEVAL
jgi:hypothetical protein